MPLARILLCGVTSVLLGCSPPPGLAAGGRILPSGEAVTLLPLADLLVEADSEIASDASAAALVARAARLRARSAAK